LTRVDFHPEAEAELLAAARYYEDHAENLGLDFLTAVEATCARALGFPEIGHSFGPRLRRILVPRFPFGLLYRLESDRLLVVAVANLYRGPGYWRSRT
jgi:plasmid stabilization system protein ParE